MRVPRLPGVRGSLFKCPGCRLKFLKAAAGLHGVCPRCSHTEPVRVDALRGGVPTASASPRTLR